LKDEVIAEACWGVGDPDGKEWRSILRLEDNDKSRRKKKGNVYRGRGPSLKKGGDARLGWRFIGGKKTHGKGGGGEEPVENNQVFYSIHHKWKCSTISKERKLSGPVWNDSFGAFRSTNAPGKKKKRKNTMFYQVGTLPRETDVIQQSDIVPEETREKKGGEGHMGIKRTLGSGGGGTNNFLAIRGGSESQKMGGGHQKGVINEENGGSNETCLCLTQFWRAGVDKTSKSRKLGRGLGGHEHVEGKHTLQAGSQLGQQVALPSRDRDRKKRHPNYEGGSHRTDRYKNGRT